MSAARAAPSDRVNSFLRASFVAALFGALALLHGCGASDPQTSSSSGDPTGASSDAGLSESGADGDAGSSSHPPSDSGSPCAQAPAFAFATEDARVVTNGDQESRWLRKTVPGLGMIAIHLSSGASGSFAAQTIDLACAPGTMCQSGEIDTNAGLGRSYLIERGTLRIDTLASPDSNEMTGTLTHLRFRAVREVQVDGGATIETVDPNGACIDVADMAVDTRAPIGTPCIDHAQCGRTKVCAMSTKTCALSECSNSAPCADGLSCVAPRDQASTARACVRACDNFAPCPGDQACEAHVCKNVPLAGAALGAACSPRPDDVVTQCQAGLVCDRTLGATNVCKKACNPLAADPGCAASERCLPAGFCGAPVSSALHVAVGADCTLPPSSQPNVPAPTVVLCGDDGKSYRGACFTSATIPYGSPPSTTCWPLCSPLGGPSCAPPTQCSPTPVNLETSACQPYY